MDVKCAFCGDTGPIHDHPPMEVEKADGWTFAHQPCIYWTPESYTLQDGGYGGVAKGLSRGRQLKCFLCKQTGAPIGCWSAHCQKTYHYPCARNDGCLMHEDTRQVYCWDHRQDAAARGFLIPEERGGPLVWEVEPEPEATKPAPYIEDDASEPEYQIFSIAPPRKRKSGPAKPRQPATYLDDDEHSPEASENSEDEDSDVEVDADDSGQSTSEGELSEPDDAEPVTSRRKSASLVQQVIRSGKRGRPRRVENLSPVPDTPKSATKSRERARAAPAPVTPPTVSPKRSAAKAPRTTTSKSRSTAVVDDTVSPLVAPSARPQPVDIATQKLLERFAAMKKESTAATAKVSSPPPSSNRRKRRADDSAETETPKSLSPTRGRSRKRGTDPDVDEDDIPLIVDEPAKRSFKKQPRLKASTATDEEDVDATPKVRRKPVNKRKESPSDEEFGSTRERKSAPISSAKKPRASSSGGDDDDEHFGSSRRGRGRKRESSDDDEEDADNAEEDDEAARVHVPTLSKRAIAKKAAADAAAALAAERAAEEPKPTPKPARVRKPKPEPVSVDGTAGDETAGDAALAEKLSGTTSRRKSATRRPITVSDDDFSDSDQEDQDEYGASLSRSRRKIVPEQPSRVSSRRTAQQDDEFSSEAEAPRSTSRRKSAVVVTSSPAVVQPPSPRAPSPRNKRKADVEPVALEVERPVPPAKRSRVKPVKELAVEETELEAEHSTPPSRARTKVVPEPAETVEAKPASVRAKRRRHSEDDDSDQQRTRRPREDDKTAGRLSTRVRTPSTADRAQRTKASRRSSGRTSGVKYTDNGSSADDSEYS
eukprot:TRINITY_DN10426_c0_g1_i1.p1 TRINITY_DN10426_c0_g1~~TRINITY_DN10426_c0_g1_i1.p1  ORF type:complete len:824 (-),score=170.23 TRINITY_DN10426_c0_g1_i1:60-2531(-)